MPAQKSDEKSHILLGVSGSIAAYKAVLLCRELTTAGYNVQVALTQNATRFVGEATFAALSRAPVICDLWDSAENTGGSVQHVEAAHRADLVVIAPATADLISRMAQGRANDALTAIVLSSTAPKLIAPAMEDGMWKNPATQANIATLRSRGFVIVEPESGSLASGREGMGRMAEPHTILAHINQLSGKKDLAGQRILVTAGPTRERFDPARFISNPSTGKMGYALAEVAAARGADVKLVSGPTHLQAPGGCEVIRVETTQEMLEACQSHVSWASCLLMAAAPADYRPAVFSPGKQKKTAPQDFRVELAHTPDILMTLNPRPKGIYVVGFAAESGQLITHAKDKLARKNLDLIVANDITRPDAGFGVDTNAVTLIDREGNTDNLPVMSKHEVAAVILDRVGKALVKA